MNKKQKFLTGFMMLCVMGLLQSLFSPPLCAQQNPGTAADMDSVNNPTKWKVKTIAPGIIYKKAVINILNSRQKIYVTEIDQSYEDNYIGLFSTSPSVAKLHTKAAALGAEAAINGTYFYTATDGTGVFSSDYLYINDTVVNNYTSSSVKARAPGAFTIYDGKVKIIPYNTSAESYTQFGSAQDGMTCGPALLFGGVYQDLSQIANVNFGGENPARNPRTAVGTNGDKVYFVVVDGRQGTQVAAGMTTQELRWFMKQLGCTDAINMDGGGSSCMYVKGETSTYGAGVVNQPSDGTVRSVPNGIYVKKGTRVVNQFPAGITSANFWISADQTAAQGLTTNNLRQVTRLRDRMQRSALELCAYNSNPIPVNSIGGALNAYPAFVFKNYGAIQSGRKLRVGTFAVVAKLKEDETLMSISESDSVQYTADRYVLKTANGKIYSNDGSSPNPMEITSTPGIFNSYQLFYVSFSESGDSFRLNGIDQNGFASNSWKRKCVNGRLFLGAWIPYSWTSTNNSSFSGNLVEAVAFPGALSDSEKCKLESYLGIKYQLPLGERGRNYMLSNGSIIYAPNDSYRHFMNFVVRDDVSGLDISSYGATTSPELNPSSAVLSIQHGPVYGTNVKVPFNHSAVAMGDNGLALSRTKIFCMNKKPMIQSERAFLVRTSGQAIPISLRIKTDSLAVGATDSLVGIFIQKKDGSSEFKKADNMNRSNRYFTCNNLAFKDSCIFSIVLGESNSIAAILVGPDTLSSGNGTQYEVQNNDSSAVNAFWGTSDSTIASVSKNGVVTALKEGYCNLIYTYEGFCGNRVELTKPIRVISGPLSSSFRDDHIQTFPNPVRTGSLLRVILPTEKKYSYSWYDLKGNQILSGPLETGTHLEIPTPSFPGMYTLILSNRSGRSSCMIRVK